MEGTDLSMEKIIEMAVTAGRMAAQRTPADAYKATERRLYALPILREKLEYDRERLPSLGDAARADLEECMAEDAAEIAELERALVNCAGDAYYQAMTGRYFDGLKDEYLAKLLHCDAVTVGRHRKRLVQKVSVWLYGAAAVRYWVGQRLDKSWTGDLQERACLMLRVSCGRLAKSRPKVGRKTRFLWSDRLVKSWAKVGRL